MFNILQEEDIHCFTTRRCSLFYKKKISILQEEEDVHYFTRRRTYFTNNLFEFMNGTYGDVAFLTIRFLSDFFKPFKQ